VRRRNDGSVGQYRGASAQAHPLQMESAAEHRDAGADAPD
jgi:hypothetical protein